MKERDYYIKRLSITTNLDDVLDKTFNVVNILTVDVPARQLYQVRLDDQTIGWRIEGYAGEESNVVRILWLDKDTLRRMNRKMMTGNPMGDIAYYSAFDTPALMPLMDEIKEQVEIGTKENRNTLLLITDVESMSNELAERTLRYFEEHLI